MQAFFHAFETAPGTSNKPTIITALTTPLQRTISTAFNAAYDCANFSAHAAADNLSYTATNHPANSASEWRSLHPAFPDPFDAAIEFP